MAREIEAIEELPNFCQKVGELVIATQRSRRGRRLAKLLGAITQIMSSCTPKTKNLPKFYCESSLLQTAVLEASGGKSQLCKVLLQKLLLCKKGGLSSE